jgi:uncharacterized membrane protein
MNRYFLTKDTIERAQGERRDAAIPRMGVLARPFQKSISRLDRSLHPRLIGPGAVLLIAAFATDVTYAKTLLFQWDNFSIWLLTGGLLLAAFAGLALVLDIALHRITGIDWLRFSGFVAAALLSLLNAFVHSRDAYTAVVPQGLELSALVTAILVVVGWRGWSVGVRHSSRPTISKEAHS